MSKNRIVIALGACLACLATLPALAQDDPERLDAKCLAFSALLKSQQDPSMKAAGDAMSMFFMGRVSARGKTVDLDKVLVDLRPEIAGGVGPMRDRCGAIFSAAPKLLVAAPPAAPAPAAPGR